MRADEFFEEVAVDDPFGIGATSSRTFRTDLVRQLRAGPAVAPDEEVAVALARLIHEDLQSFGTDGHNELSNPEMREALLALRALADRLGIDGFDPEFRDFDTFKSYWLRKDAYGSWQARRDLLNQTFDPLHDQLTLLETRSLTSTLAEPISPHGQTGWARVDAEISELRRHFRAARSEQDHRNVGNDCVAILEAVSRVAYQAERHLPDGEDEPKVADTKKRLDRVVEVELPGSANKELRKLARAAIETAQAVKHRSTPDRRSAGLAADAVILVANMLRRVGQQD